MEILKNSILFFFLFILFNQSVQAQTSGTPNTRGRDFQKKSFKGIPIPQKGIIPPDSALVQGKLENGLRYYIRKNQEPKNRAELRLVLKVGSVLENDNQVGLAHFTEHMAFNGTQHFQHNDLVNFLEKSGVKFGADLNAHTSFDETVYQLTLPTDTSHLKGDSISLFEKGFQIMEDWAQFQSFNDEEIDKERGVVIEEWRLGRGANARLRDQYFPQVFKNSRYADRLPIGKKEVLESFPHELIRKFYQDWYRPDLEAILVVGDLDIEKTIELIKAHFSSLKNPVSERPRTQYTLPNFSETRISILTDKEQPYTIAQWVNLLPQSKDYSLEDLNGEIRRSLFNALIKSRISEILQKPNSPFLFASSAFNSFFGGRDAFQNFIVVKGGKDILPGIQALKDETDRIRKFGFTQSELDRAKLELMSGMEKQFQEKDKTNSKVFIQAYIENFLHEASIPSISFSYQYFREHLPELSLSSINSLANSWNPELNRYAVITAPEKEKANLPNSGELLNALQKGANEDLKPYIDKLSKEPLFGSIPKETAVITKRNYPKSEVEEIQLKNGMRIFLKPTHFKNDQILFAGYRKGGTSFFSDSSYLNAAYSAPLIQESGLGNFDNIALEKALAGKRIFVSPFIDQYQQGFSGNSSVPDFETALQILNLYFTKPRKDPKVFESFIQKESGFIQNRNSDPGTVFSDSISRIMSQNNFRNKSLSLSDLQKIKLDSAFSIFQRAFSNPGEFTFTFIGNFESPKIKELLSRYLGNLPNSNDSFKIKDDLKDYPQGLQRKIIYQGSEPKSQVRLIFTGPAEFSMDQQNQISTVMAGLTIKLRENLRENQGGTYGVNVYGGIDREPRKRYHITISFGCSPEKVDTLISSALFEIDQIKKNGLSSTDLDKIRSQNKRELELNLVKNEFWLRRITEYSFHEDPIDNIISDYFKFNQVSLEQTRQAANTYFSKNLTEIILKPAQKK